MKSKLPILSVITLFLILITSCDSVDSAKSIVFEYEVSFTGYGTTTITIITPGKEISNYPVLFLLNDSYNYSYSSNGEYTFVPSNAFMGLGELETIAYDYNMILVLLEGSHDVDDFVDPYNEYVEKVVEKIDELNLTTSEKRGILALHGSAYESLDFYRNTSYNISSLSLLDPATTKTYFNENPELLGGTKLYFDVSSYDDSGQEAILSNMQALKDSLLNAGFTMTDSLPEADNFDFTYTEYSSAMSYYMWINKLQDHFYFHNLIFNNAAKGVE